MKIVYRETKVVQRKITEKNETCKMLDEKFVSLVEGAEKKRGKRRGRKKA